MNMQEAAARLGQIIRKLGAGTSTIDQGELEQLHQDMLAHAAPAATTPKPRRAREAKPRADKTVKPLKGESVAKAKRPRK